MEITIRVSPGLEPPETEPARQAARTLLSHAVRANAEISVLLTDDAEIHRLNRDWRGIDRPTDVLSWPQEALEPPVEGILASSDDPVLGDVAISLDTARRQATVRGWAVADEVALLLVHGILHLLGYEDDTEEGADAMRAVETHILGRPLEKTDAISG